MTGLTVDEGGVSALFAARKAGAPELSLPWVLRGQGE
jgi:hypothetical protein